MGRRSINTTKSGKYMNPTDQARKEARKRELKKNKKQRQMVRAAVLKGKDPLQLINDMEKIDEMEFNVNAPPILNEKVLKDKRKKLKETWDRVMRLYFKEDRERFNELKKLELEYEGRRNILVKYFESVRIAQQVTIDEIPLPDTPEMPVFLTSQIPLPNEMSNFVETENFVVPPSILKKTVLPNDRDLTASRLKAPGVPPGPIPDLSSDEEDDNEAVSRVEERSCNKSDLSKMELKNAKNKKIRFADEDENESDSDEEISNEKGKESDFMDSTLAVNTVFDKQKIEDIPIPPMPQSTGSGPVVFRPAAAPPIRAHIPPPPRMMPPGVPPPPPGRPTLPPPGIPIRIGAPPIRLPPGPPPGLPPPRLMRPPTAPPPRLPAATSAVAPPGTAASTPGAGNLAVLSAPPSLMQRPKPLVGEDESQRSATIEAKPQIRNLSADLMRFMPTALRVKREDRQRKGGVKVGNMLDQAKDNYPTAAPLSNPSAPVPTKDDAYQQFLREMEELL